MRRRALIHFVLAWLTAALARPLFGDVTPASGPDAQADSELSMKDRFINSLPPAIGDDLDIDTWGWLGGLQTNYENHRYYDAEVGLGITKSFDQRVALGGQVNFIDANGETRFELEQGYLSAKLCEQTQTLLTVGKFNAAIGVEGRDFWSRTTGTPSLLFAAEPQDLLGVMITQPIGESGLTIRPFITEGFESAYDFNQSPSAGFTTEYKPNRKFELAMTNWIGPGMLLYGGKHMQQPFPRAYGGQPGSDPTGVVIENWEGPNFYASRGSTLYFGDASCIVRPTPDWTIDAECLLGTTDTSRGGWGWSGFMLMVSYQVSDPMHIYTRWSSLDDDDWLVTGVYQHCQELSCGAGYEVFKGVEVRGEYRHDFSDVTPNFDSVSLHVTFTY